MNSFNPELHLRDTKSPIEIFLKNRDLQSELRVFKLVTTLVSEFKNMEINEEARFTTFYSFSKAETIVNESDTDDVFESIYITVITCKKLSLDYWCDYRSYY